MPPTDTIAARSTAPGRSPRAMIRMSGPGVRSLWSNLLASEPADRRAGAARLSLPGATFPVLACFAAGPRSYTGEDAAEWQLPGNPALIDRILAEITSHPGVRLAQPGEFTARAYLAGKMPLEAAEGIAAAISADTDAQLAAAAALMSGETGRRYAAWAEETAALAALVEAGIDFTDQEDVVAIAPAELRSRSARLIEAIEVILGARRAAEQAETLPRVALIGLPNAGKSTLFNALLGRARAVTAPVAGTTRDVLAEPLDLSADVPGAGEVLLLDLAGIERDHPGLDLLDALGRSAAALAAKEADARVWCDPTGRFESASLPADLASSPRLIRVRTFADRPGGDDGLAVCALDGWNMGSLRRAIADAAFGSAGSTLADLLPRHRHALRTAAGGLRAAHEAAGLGPRLDHPEVVADGLRAALDALGELVGRISPDDVLGRVFSTFCVGK